MLHDLLRVTISFDRFTSLYYSSGFSATREGATTMCRSAKLIDRMI